LALADDFRASLRELPDDWGDARFTLRLPDAARAARAAAALGGINPGRHGDTVRFYTTRRGAGHGPDVVARALRRVDAQRLGGELELVSSDRAEPVPETRRPTLTAAWDAAVAGLPPDWSDVYAEVELTSSDHLERAALLMAPANPARYSGRPGFRFRCARSFGYGAAPEMVRRCFERLDAAGIRGEVRILHALSDTKPWSTQGPVWYVGGRSV
jgi:hypothetical protein